MERPSSYSKNAPYARKDGRKSFFSKMKDTMRDMLSPSWLTDRASQGKESDSRDQASGAHNDPEIPVIQPGPPRLQGMETQPSAISRDLHFKSQGAFHGNGQPRTLEFVGINPGQESAPSGMMMPPFQPAMFPPPISEFTSAQLPLARLSEKSDSVMAHEDTMSQRSDGSKSTSGCSSMIPQTDMPQKDAASEKRKAPEQESVSRVSPHEQPSVKRQKLQTGGSLNTTFTRRLSDTFVHRQAPSAVNNRPAFNASLFDSPLHNESSLLGTSFHESSFYPGKTTFGGRSSLSFRSNRKKVDLNQSLPSRLSVPVKAFMKAKPRVNPSKEAVTSSTAKRILEALDKMPTPLNDAKKIPLMAPRQWTESPSYSSRDRTPSRARSGPPTQKLNISAQATISKNRQVSFAPVVQSKPASEQVPVEKPSLPTRQDTVVLNSEPAVGSGKMRRDKSYHRGSASVKLTMVEEDTVILPNLQTDYTLSVNSMPQFNFSTPVVQQKTPANSKSTFVSQPPMASSSPVKPSVNFTFSSPIHEDVPVNKPASPPKYSGFQFSSPISVEKASTSTPISVDKTNTGPPIGGEKTSSGLAESAYSPFSSSVSGGLATKAAFSFGTSSNKALSMDSNFSTAPKPKPKLNGPSEPLGGGFSAASQLKQGSVMDILGGGSFSKPSSTKADSSSASSVQLTTSAPPLSALFKSSGWSCDICLISNKADAVKCIACQTPKPSTFKDTPVKQDSTVEMPKANLFAKFQQPTGSWSCDICLIQNKPDTSKCIACQTPKPGGTKSSSPLLAGSVQPGNWICNTCLIQNKKDDNVCGACKAAKSAPAPASSKTMDLNKSDSLFSKFKPSSGQWECEICLVQNKAELSKCVACQSPKPLKAFKHPPGDWVCDTCLVNNKETDVNCVACNYARPGPPRTQTVPSIAKSYTSSQASGFSIPKTSAPSGSISVASTGGFTFTAASSSENKTPGFNVNFTSKKEEKSSDSASVTGGFKFNAPSVVSSSGNGFKTDASGSSGFKIGAAASTENTKSNTNTGGFKFGAAVPSNNNGSESKKDDKDSNSIIGGFQIGKSNSLSSNSVNSSSGATTGGFTFGQKAESSSAKPKESVTATTSVPGGFTFESSDSSVSSVQSNNTVATTVTSSIGGFNFPTVTSVSNSAAVPSIASTEGFQFTATKLTQSSATSATSDKTESKPAFGGFSFGQQASGTNTSMSTFNAAQKQMSSPNKRGRDEDSEESSTKKSFNFGQAPASNASTPFQFGATTATSKSSSFGMGQAPATSTASSGLFAFGQQNSAATATKSSSSLFAFGQQNSKPATSVASSSNSTYVFGQQNPISSTTSIAPMFGQGGATPAATTSTSASLFNQFGNSNASTATTSAFNFTATNSAPSGNLPAFGSTPSFNFDSQKTDSTTTASGTGVFNFGAQPAPATTPAFGSSFGSSATPVFGSSGGVFSGNAPSTTPAFGATPPAFGSSNNTTPAVSAFGGACITAGSDIEDVSSTMTTNRLHKTEGSILQYEVSSSSSEESFFHGCITDSETSISLGDADTQLEEPPCTGMIPDVLGKVQDKNCKASTLSVGIQTWTTVGVSQTDVHKQTEELSADFFEDNTQNTIEQKLVPDKNTGIRLKDVSFSGEQIGTQLTSSLRCSHSEILKTSTQSRICHSSSLLEHTQVNNLQVPKVISPVPQTGVANEPLSWGKLLVVPFFEDLVAKDVYTVSPAVSHPLMSTRVAKSPVQIDGTAMPPTVTLPPTRTSSIKLSSNLTSIYKNTTVCPTFACQTIVSSCSQPSVATSNESGTEMSTTTTYCGIQHFSSGISSSSDVRFPNSTSISKSDKMSTSIMTSAVYSCSNFTQSLKNTASVLSTLSTINSKAGFVLKMPVEMKLGNIGQDSGCNSTRQCSREGIGQNSYCPVRFGTAINVPEQGIRMPSTFEVCCTSTTNYSACTSNTYTNTAMAVDHVTSCRPLQLNPGSLPLFGHQSMSAFSGKPWSTCINALQRTTSPCSYNSSTVSQPICGVPATTNTLSIINSKAGFVLKFPTQLQFSSFNLGNNGHAMCSTNKDYTEIIRGFTPLPSHSALKHETDLNLPSCSFVNKKPEACTMETGNTLPRSFGYTPPGSRLPYPVIPVYSQPVVPICSQPVLFSFTSPEPVDDVIMEELTPVTDPACSNSSTATAALEDSMSSRKVTFNFRPPDDAGVKRHPMLLPMQTDKHTRSILKTKTNEMFFAFDSTFLFNKEDSSSVISNGSHKATETVTEAPSASSIFGGKKLFSDRGNDTSSSKSAVFDSIYGTHDEAHQPTDCTKSNLSSMKKFEPILDSRENVSKWFSTSGDSFLPFENLNKNVTSGDINYEVKPSVFSATPTSAGECDVSSCENKVKVCTNKALSVSAFSGKPPMSEKLASPSSSRSSTTDESSRSSSRSSVSDHSEDSSGSDTDSSHDDHHSSDEDDDDEVHEMNTEVMDDDGTGCTSINTSNSSENDSAGDFYTSFSGRGNQSWNACPENERFTDLYEGVFGNNSQPPAQAPQANAVFQFGAKPTESTPAATTGFNFNSAPAGLGQASSFNFGGQAQTQGVNVFNATGPAAPVQEGRKIKKAIRKIRR